MNRNLLFAALLAAGLAQAGLADAADIKIVNLDQGTGQGLDDPTPTTPIGGNPGTTKGEQAQIVFQFAADLWGAALESDVEILNTVTFQPLACDATSGVLGSSGTNYIFAFEDGPDLPPGMLAETWYHSALGDAIAGTDLGIINDLPADTPDIISQFNGKLGEPGCLTGNGWYYGLDGNTPSDRISLIDVIMHEMAHGLGFSGFNNLASGALNQGIPDVYSTYVADNSTGKNWVDMTDAERVAAAKNNGHLVFFGQNVKDEAPLVLTSGTDDDGNVKLYAPTALAQGSSFSHYDTSLTMNALMEPFINDSLSADVLLDLTPALFKDVGWTVNGGNQMLLDCDTGVPTSVTGGLIAGANIYASAKAFAGGAENLLVYRDQIRDHADVLADDEVITPDQHTSLLACLTDEATATQFEEWGNGDTGEPCDPETEECGPDVPDAIALTNKVPVTGLSGTGGEVLYSFEAEAGSVLSIMTYGGTGDVSVYVSLGEEPTADSYDSRSTRAGNSETVRFTAPEAGTYYIKLAGTYGKLTLVARQ